MGYATVTDVQQLNTARTFTATSKPTATQVIDWLEQTAGVIDGILHGQGYTLPVPTTATGVLKQLEHYNALGAAAFVEQGAPSSDRRKEAMDLWKQAQKMLRDGNLELDTPEDSSLSLPRGPRTATPYFTLDMAL
jgi:hypothetical protein